MYECAIEHLLRAQQELAYAKAIDLLPDESQANIQMSQGAIVKAIEFCERSKVAA